MLRSFYLSPFFYYSCFAAAALFVLSYFFEPFFLIANVLLLFALIAVLVDTLLLYQKMGGVDAIRMMQARFSNGDDNKVTIELENEYGFTVHCSLIDELPFQFQERNWKREVWLKANTKSDSVYSLKPQERG